MRQGLRLVLLALLASLLFGLAVGTWLRIRMERPVQYIGLTAHADGERPA